MQYCLELAAGGLGKVAPNPMVGACLVYQDRIIGTGFHTAFGQAHAEVNAINNVAPEDIPLIPESTLYVTLEPCSHFGKTPPCADLIIKNKIQRVVIGMQDPNTLVSGNGIIKLKTAGIEVVENCCKVACENLNRAFILYHRLQRPYYILKWAESADGFIADASKLKTQISGKSAQVLLHKWRTEVDAILVGRRTVEADLPQLNARHWIGKNPLPIFIDPELKMLDFYSTKKCLVFNKKESSKWKEAELIQIDFEKYLDSLHAELYKRNIQTVLVEGGTTTIEKFFQADILDEIRVIKSKVKYLNDGVKAPVFKGCLEKRFALEEEDIYFYQQVLEK